MKRRMLGAAALVLALGTACDGHDLIVVGGDGPAPPRSLGASYYAGAVTVTWELSPLWDDEAFRVYSKRVSDPDYFLIAEVTSCAGGVCTYTDVNVLPGVSYDYFVAAVDPSTGEEAASEFAVRVDVPQPTPPPAPAGFGVVALDGANFLHWDASARTASDFSHYRVYLLFEGDAFLLGETDSEGFLDLLAENGLTYTYFVTSLDTQGHESQGSASAAGTPRPDFHGELIYDFFDRPALSGFRFQQSEDLNPVVDGASATRHFRLETDADGWWLVPGPGTSIYPQGFATTALECGVAADAQCVALGEAPTSGYQTADVGLFPQTTYVLRVQGDDGLSHYAAIRVELLGFDEEASALMIFDWSYQLQPGNPSLAPRPVPVR